MADQPTYRRSRAADREKFGSRTIDARTKYSARDSTPSAREARFAQQGLSKAQSVIASDEAFAEQFRPSSFTNPEVVPSRRAIQAPLVAQNRFASPEMIRDTIQMGGTGKMQTPFGPVVLPGTPNASSLLPAMDIQDMAEFMPNSVGPLSSFALPKPGLLSKGRWNKSTFG